MRTIHFIATVMLCLVCWHCQSPSDNDQKSVEQKQLAAQSEQDKKIILSINNRIFTNETLKEYIKNQYADIDTTSSNPKLLSRIFDFFIEQEMILYKIEQEKVNLDDIDQKDFLDTLQFENRIEQQNFSNNIKIQKFLYFLIYRDIGVSDQDIKDYYDSHIEEFRKNEEVQLYQILVKDKDKSTQISGILKNFPQRFEEIARSESQSPEAKKGGLMGYFERGTLPKEMEDVVFSLLINEISPIVESPYGYHIFKVTQKRNKRVLFLNSVKEDIKQNVLAEKLRSAYQEYLTVLKKELKIEKHSENLFFTYFPDQGGPDENN
jgi:parvulin-like peptidyl-prolyl isomerase